MTDRHIIAELLERTAEAYPDYAAVRWLVKKETLEKTYRELDRDRNMIASALRRYGFEGKHAALVGTSSYAWIAAWLGIVSGKTASVPLDPSLPAPELCDLISRSDSEVLFLSPKMLPLLEAVKADCPAVRLCVLLEEAPAEKGSRSPAGPGASAAEDGRPAGEGESPAAQDFLVLSLSEFTAGESGAALPPDMRPLPEDVSTILFTSGTTGKPKGVMLTQCNLYDDVANVVVSFAPGTTMLSVLPIHHAYCLVMDWLKGFSAGAVIYINDSLLHLVRNIGIVKPQIILMVPLMIETIGKRLAAIDSPLPKREIAKQLLGENLQYIFSGGAHLDPSYIDMFERYGIQVCEGYGMSECSPTISTNGENGSRPGSVGKLLANMQIRFVEGEIQVKGSNVMKGYYKMPEETREAFSDGWLRTGDLGYMDEDGYLYITGRLKNLIILSNGENISPEEVENALLRDELVCEAVISGGENGLCARIYPDPDVIVAGKLPAEHVAARLQEVLDAYNKNQPSYRAITSLKIRRTPFIKNATKKIVRAKMDIEMDTEI